MNQSTQRVAAAEAKQFAAWAAWNEEPTAANMVAWDRAVEAWRDEQDRAECVADRMEAVRESEQASWWVAAKFNARVQA